MLKMYEASVGRLFQRQQQNNTLQDQTINEYLFANGSIGGTGNFSMFNETIENFKVKTNKNESSTTTNNYDLKDWTNETILFTNFNKSEIIEGYQKNNMTKIPLLGNEKCFSYPTIRLLVFSCICLEVIKIVLGFLRYLRKNKEQMLKVLPRIRSTFSQAENSKRQAAGGQSPQVYKSCFLPKLSHILIVKIVSSNRCSKC